MNASESQSSSDTMMMMDIDPPLHHRPSTASSSSTQQLMAASSSRKPLPSEDVDMNGGEGSGASSSSRGAGPSTLPFYTMAPVRHGPPHLRMRLHPSQDLITRLGLLPAFDDLVRPFIRVPTTTTTEGGADGVDEKGKGKEVDMGSRGMQGVEGLDGQQASTAVGSSAKPEGGEENKKEHKNGWRSLVQPHIPGKFSTKKDTYLGDLTANPARQPMKIRPFDLGTLNGFRLEEGQLDAATLQVLGLGPDEKKKKKKKKKALADGTAATADSTTGGAGPSQTGGTPAGMNGSSGGGTPRPSNNQAAPSPRPAIHPAYLKANSPYPQSNRPPSVQTPTLPPATFGTGGPGGHNSANYWHGQPVPPEANGVPKPPGATSVVVNGKNARVRKERDEGPGTPGPSTSQAQAGGQAPRPHKKRKMDGSGSGPSGGPSQHHGMAAHHQQQQPMQQATPTF